MHGTMAKKNCECLVCIYIQLNFLKNYYYYKMVLNVEDHTYM